MTGATAINCTQCGAGLDVLGGGRVRAHVCGYCGAELDAQDKYKVLRQFKDMKRPATPFQIGMEGEIDGVRMVVIGTVGREEVYGGRSWSWVNHQLYSPTHGYAWLTWEDGNVVFTRKTRRVPNPSYISEHRIENSESRPTVRLDDRIYTYYSSGNSRITFVEGEFNWIPELGDRNKYVSFSSSDEMLNIAEGKKEREYELTNLMDRDAIFESFGVDGSEWSVKARIHALTPFERSSDAGFARNLAFACSALCLIVALVMLGMGSQIAQGTARTGDVLKVPFEVTDSSRLVQVELSANVDNSWAGLEAEIVDDKDETVFSFERGVEYYHGYDDGYWSEGSQAASVYLRLDAGKYNLTTSMSEAQRNRLPSQIGVQIWEGVVSSFWLWIGFVVFLLIGVAFLLQRYWHHKQRMAGSDWDDE